MFYFFEFFGIDYNNIILVLLLYFNADIIFIFQPLYLQAMFSNPHDENQQEGLSEDFESDREQDLPKQGKSLKSLRWPFYKWLVISFDKKSRKVITEKIKTRSPAWIVYRKADNNIQARCRICRHFNRAKFGNTTQLLRHIDSEHYGIKKKLQQIFEARKSNAIYEKINLIEMMGNNNEKEHLEAEQRKKESEKQRMKYLSKQIEEEDKRFKKLDSKKIIRASRGPTTSEYEIHYSETLKKIKLNENVQVYEQISNQDIVSALFLTKYTQQISLRYGDIISFWFHPQPTNSDQLTSVVFILAQDSNSSPVILGLFLIFIQSLTSYAIIQQFFQQSSLVFRPPHKIILNGPIWLHKLFVEYLNFTKECNLKNSFYETSLVYIEEILQEIENNELALYLLDRKITQVSKGCSHPFLGFILSFGFIGKISELTLRSNGKKLQSFEEFLNRILKIHFSYLASSNIKSLNLGKNDSLVACAPMIKYALEIPQLSDLVDKLSSFIFLKLSYASIFAKSSLFPQYASQGQVHVSTINKPDIWNICSKYQVAYSLLDQKWHCECFIHDITGIPCPHLLCVLFTQGISIENYIHPKWFIKFEDSKSLLASKLERSNVNIIQINIKENQQSQKGQLNSAYSLPADIDWEFSQDKFNTLFWGQL